MEVTQVDLIIMIPLLVYYPSYLLVINNLCIPDGGGGGVGTHVMYNVIYTVEPLYNGLVGTSEIVHNKD